MKIIEVNQEVREMMKHVAAFSYLDDAAFENMLSLCTIKSYEKGEQIIKDGEVSQNLYAVLDGTVHVSVTDPSGKDVYICSTGAGQLFGEAGIFLKVKRTADVFSTDDSIILKIHRDDLTKFLNMHPHGGIKFLMVMIYTLLKKLKESNRELAYERTTDIDQKDVDEMIKDILG